MIYGYVRCSTAEQAAEGKSTLDDQERRIVGAAMMRGQPVERVFSDPGVSGARQLATRPSGRELLAALQPGDVVIAAKMDRLFRSAQDALTTVEQMQRDGVGLILADMGPDPVTENGMGKLFFTMAAAFAEFERTRIAERVADGRRAKGARGGFIGGDAPYGFRCVGQGRDAVLAVDEDEQRTLARVRELAPGRSLRQIAAALASEGLLSRTGRLFAPSQVQGMLRRETASTAPLKPAATYVALDPPATDDAPSSTPDTDDDVDEPVTVGVRW